MSRLISLLILISLAAFAAGQPTADVGRYLRERDLDDVYAALLSYRLERASGDRRIELAQELARVYIRLLNESQGRPDAGGWAEAASDLLRVVPEAETPELTLELARSAYVNAEAIAERVRLRLADEQSAAEAERTLRQVAPTFLAIAQESHRLAERTESDLGRRLDRDEEDALSQRLTEARRLRSLGFYLAGWSEYYLAVVTDDPSRAEQALRRFGWLLGGADGEPASLERLQPGLLQYEHVARAAIGASLASAFTGRIVEANAWLDAVERETAVPGSVREQIPSRRAVVFAQGGLWRDLDTLARRWLSPEAGEGDPTLARLIAVLTLEADRNRSTGRQSELVRRLTDLAFADLIASGQIAHVVDLGRLYGTERLGSDGFIAQYVRGLLQLEAADEAADGLAELGAVQRAAFSEAGDGLAEALAADNAGDYPAERATAMFRAGQAYARANRIDDAAPLLEQAWNDSSDQTIRSDALWALVVSLGSAVERGRDDMVEARNRAVMLYLGAFPGTERASVLVMQPSTAALLSSDEAVDILLATPRSADSYPAARRQAAVLLYSGYRRASRGDREQAGQRFVTLSEQLIAEDLSLLRELNAQQAAEFAENLVLRARRLADAAMGLNPPSIRSARFAIEAIDRVASYASLDISANESEITFRRLQIASASGDLDAAMEHLATLDEAGGPHRVAGVRLLYRDAARAWIADRDSDRYAGDVLRLGAQVVSDLESEPAAAGVLAAMLDAAEQLWDSRRDRSARDAGIDTGMKLRELGRDDATANAALARLLEAADRNTEALEAWRLVLAGTEAGSPAWFNARLESLRLLSGTDTQAAKTVAEQFIALHPDLGPAATRERFRELLASLGVRPGAAGQRGGG